MMEAQQHNNVNDNVELDLYDLVKALWRQKGVIVCITLIITILAGVISLFFITPVYHSKLNIIINMPETYQTKYGEYILPITTNEQYAKLITSNDILINTMKDMEYDTEKITLEGLRDRIIIETVAAVAGIEQNSFEVKVAADNPIEASKLAQMLFNNYVEFIDVMTLEGAFDFYINNYTTALEALEVSVQTTKEILLKNERLLAETPQTINQKEAMNALNDQANSNEYVVLENIINPNYTAIEKDIITNRQSINSYENSMRVYNEYLDELGKMGENILSYTENGDFEKLSSLIVSATNTNIFLSSVPVSPSQKTSPSNALNVAIGCILGGMIGILTALSKECWFNKA
jgi:capsular polysaccharide biosynthesis protein